MENKHNMAKIDWIKHWNKAHQIREYCIFWCVTICYTCKYQITVVNPNPDPDPEKNWPRTITIYITFKNVCKCENIQEKICDRTQLLQFEIIKFQI